MTARELRDRIASAASLAHPAAPLRILARRRAPLVSQGLQLGELEALLRLSFRGDGRGEGVVVFDWPAAAAGHSAVQVLEKWSARDSRNGLEVECRSRTMESNGSPPVPGTHLKVHFDAGEMPDDLLELLALADRLGISGAVARQVAAYLPPEEDEPEAVASASPPAPSPESRPEANGEPKIEIGPATPSAPAAPRPDQDRIDRIEHHAVYDPAIHPTANPNDEVTTSAGETFRLVIRRTGGAMRRQWLRVGRVAQQA